MPEAETDPASEMADQLAEILSRYRFRYSAEKDLQAALSGALAENGIAHHREARLARDAADYAALLKGQSSGDVFDFWLYTCGVVVEVKVDGSLAGLTQQVHRYLGHPLVAAVVVVTTLSRLRRLPAEMRGKPVRVIVLPGALS